MQNTPPRVLIFDLDGTLLDTQPILNEILFAALREFGVEIEDPLAVRGSIDEFGATLIEKRAPVPNEFIDRLDLDRYPDVFWSNYEENYMRSVDRAFDGIRETLDKLRRRGYTLAVFSNKPHKYTYPIITTAFKDDIFSVIVGSSDEVPRKPDPFGVNMICEQIGVRPCEAVMIRDLSTDLHVSQNAGCNHVAALWGYGRKKKLAALGAETFANRPIDLLQLFK